MPDPVSAVFDLIVQSLGQRIWQRPELAPLRDPVEAVFSAGQVAQLARQAFDSLPAETRAALPAFLDEGFLRMPSVLDHIAAHLDTGQPADVDRLQELYAKRHLDPARAPDIRPHLTVYLGRLRETLSAHPTYGSLLLARDVQSLTMALRNLHDETRRHFDDLDSTLRERFSRMEAQFEALLREPEVRALIERKASTHVFLSYSRKNIAQALRIRNAIAADGHEVWQDISAIKGGDQWLDAIDDGIRRAYAVVIVLSRDAWESYWVREEFAHAQRHDKRIIPVNVDGCDTPFGMNQLNPLEAHTNFEAALSRLQAALPAVPSYTDAPAPAAPPATAPADPRQAERDYLNRLLLEHSVWKQLYTPMAGVARQRRDAPRRPARRVPASIQPAYVRDRIREAFPEQPETAEEPVDDIAEAVRRVRHLVVLGEPGSGKSTTLWLLAASYAEAALADPAAPLPLLLNLGALPSAVSVREQLQRQLGDGLALDDLLAQRRLALLLDALNELPAERRADKVEEVRALVQQAQRADTVAVVTCRRLDYTGALDLGILEKVDIAPLDPGRIRDFCARYLPDDGETLFWALAGEDIAHYWQVWQREGKGDFDALWASDAICQGTSTSDDDLLRELRRALRGAGTSRLLLPLARNPYMLYLITQVYDERGELPPNRGKLFDLFVDILLERETLPAAEAEALRAQLAELAFTMRRDGLGTSVPRATAQRFLSDDQLYRAASANLLEGADEVRFTHELLNEYFAARRLDRERQAGVPAATFWPPQAWWNPTGWEETAVLLAGLYSDDCTPVLDWLADAQPELTARCVLESGAQTPPAAFQNLPSRWLPRLTDLKREPRPAARAAVGRALGLLDLDNRPGVGVIEVQVPLPEGEGFRVRAIPDIAWSDPIPPGIYPIGHESESDNPPRQFELTYSYRLAKYPITYVQFKAFLDDPQGYNDPDGRWFAGLAADDYDRKMSDQYFVCANHPRDSVNWYQALAFCRWLSWRMGGGYDLDNIGAWAVRLPTEFEWEIAARGTDSREYPYRGDFDPEKGNTEETEIGQTSAVGIFPNGASPYGVLDMSGNVWEWCLTAYEKPAAAVAQEDLRSDDWRVLRGGSWSSSQYLARAAYRYWYDPGDRDFANGFRVVCCSAPS